MDEGNVSDQVAGLEDRIEALTRELARCAKISFAAKCAIAAGAIYTVRRAWSAARVFSLDINFADVTERLRALR